MRNTLRELCERDILIQVVADEAQNDEPNDGAEDAWRFANLLFQRWLALNSVPVE